MARVKRAVHSKKQRRVVLERAQGYYGNKSRLQVRQRAVMHAGQYAFRDRRARKGDFRSLWIQRINAACRENGMSYSRFIAGLGRRRSRSTARSSPTWPCASRRPSPRSSRRPARPRRPPPDGVGRDRWARWRRPCGRAAGAPQPAPRATAAAGRRPEGPTRGGSLRDRRASAPGRGPGRGCPAARGVLGRGRP